MASFDFDVAIIGAGPGGLTSALYLERFLRSTALISAGPPRASWIPRTHNLLGYRGGISGVELLGRLHRQLDECKAARIERIVGEAQAFKQGQGFRVKGDGFDLTASKLILATGMKDVEPRIDNLAQLRRRGLLRYCPVCDAFEYRGKKLVVFAQDKHGMKTARFLSRFTKRLVVLWMSPEKAPKKWLAGTDVTVVRGELAAVNDARLPSMGLTVVYTDETGRERAIKADAAYVALGSVVNDSAYRSFKTLQRNPDGYLQVGSHQELQVPGLYAVGDCVEGLAQIAVASGQAAVAATHAHNQLRAFQPS